MNPLQAFVPSNETAPPPPTPPPVWDYHEQKGTCSRDTERKDKLWFDAVCIWQAGAASVFSCPGIHNPPR